MGSTGKRNAFAPKHTKLEASEASVTEHSRFGVVWLDFASIPQVFDLREADDFEDVARSQLAAVHSIPSYLERSTYFWILAPTAIHADTGEVCNFETYRQRAWCRIEEWVNILSFEALVPLVVTEAPVLSTYAANRFLKECARRPDRCPLAGELSCCRLGHKVMDASGNSKTIPCDMKALRQVLSTMYDARLKGTDVDSNSRNLSLVSQALFGGNSDYLQEHCMSAMGSLERMPDPELLSFLKLLAGSGNDKLLFEAMASPRMREVFTRRWYDEVLMTLGITGDVHGAQLWQKCSPGFVGVEGAETGPSGHVQQTMGPTTVLQLASGHGRVDMVRWLLEQGAGVNAARIEPHPQAGRTALHNAAYFRYWDTCALLLQHRAEVNAKDCRGETALHYAVECPLPVVGHPEMQAVAYVCQALLSGGADPDIKSSDGSSALDVFSRFPVDPDITRSVKELLRRR